MFDQSPIADECLREHKELQGLRGNHEARWTESAQLFMPNLATLIQARGQQGPGGERRIKDLYDSTPMGALMKFSAALDSLASPRGRLWHKLTSRDPVLRRNRQVRLYWEDANQVVFNYRYGAQSGFTGQMRPCYRGYGGMGHGTLFVDTMWPEQGQAPGLRYRYIPVFEGWIGQNHQGIVNQHHREYTATALDLLEQFGEKALNPVQKEQAEKRSKERHTILHVVRPRKDRDPERKDYKGMRFASYYIDVKDRRILEEGGYRTWPFPTMRYDVIGNDPYSYAVADDAMPAGKVLNEISKTGLIAGHKLINPPLLTHDGGVMSGVNLKPGAVNRGGMSAEGKMLVGVVPTGYPQHAEEMMDRQRFSINDCFMLNLFQMALDDREMTATEVLERTREKAWILGPTLGDLESSFFGPLIEREIDILANLGVLPPMPRILREAMAEYEVEYDSPLSRAAQADAAAGYVRSRDDAVQMVAATGDPKHLFYLKTEQAEPEVARIRGTLERWIRDEKEVAQMVADQERQIQEQRVMEAAPGAAALMGGAAKLAGGKAKAGKAA